MAGSKAKVHENDIGWIISLPHVNSKTCSLESLSLQGVWLSVGSNRCFKTSLFVTEICCFVCSSWDSLWPCVMHGLQLAGHWQTAAWVMMWAQGSCLAKVTALHLKGTCKILKTQQWPAKVYPGGQQHGSKGNIRECSSTVTLILHYDYKLNMRGHMEWNNNLNPAYFTFCADINLMWVWSNWPHWCFKKKNKNFYT